MKGETGRRDVAAQSPEAAAMWHREKNGGGPEGVPAGSHRAAWWRCPRGHEWQAPVYAAALLGRRCPYCAGKRAAPGETDLAALRPELAAEWDAELNGPLGPEEVTAGSGRRVWWRCPEGHRYRARVDSRARGTGCPYCAGRKVWPGFNSLAALCPEVAAQWHPTLNGALTPERAPKGGKQKVWWQCGEGHVWQAAIYARTRKKGTGCPVCAGRVRSAAGRPRQAPRPRPTGPEAAETGLR